MAFLSLLSSQTDADSPLDQPMFDTIRTNFDDLDSRVSAVSGYDTEAIVTDFMMKTLPTSVWTENHTSWVAAVVETNEHYLKSVMTASATGMSGIGAEPGHIRVHFARDQRVILEGRVKQKTASSGNHLMAFGLVDDAVTVANIDQAAGLDNSIFFHRAGTEATYRFKSFKAAAAGANVSGLGTVGTNWTKFKIDCSISGGGAVIAVNAYLDDALVAGSPFSSNIPNTKLLYPFWITWNDTGTGTAGEWDLDYFLAYWVNRPLSP